MRSRRPSADDGHRPEPQTPPISLAASGGGGMRPPVGTGGPFERGTIIDVDARGGVYRVALNSGRTLVCGRLLHAPGDATTFPTGTPVAVYSGFGTPYIFGALPFEVARDDQATRSSVTDVDGHGGDDPVFDRPHGAVARAPDEARDVMPGDVVHVSADGASIGALRGPIAQLRAGPLAKVQAFGDTDTVQIIAGLMRIVTWMGESRVTNEGGRTSFIWRGGSDQLTETGPDEERYTLRLDLGASGDVARFEVTTPEGHAVFRLHVSAAGRVEVFAAGGVDYQSGNGSSSRHPTRTNGPVSHEVDGTYEREIRGAETRRVTGTRRMEVSGASSETFGDAVDVRVNGDDRRNTGGDCARVVVGACRTVVGGNCETRVSGTGFYGVTTTGGNIDLTATGQKVRVRGIRENGIELGADPTEHGTKWESLNSQLTALAGRVAQIGTLVAAHVHPVSGAATLVSPTLAPVAVAISFDLTPARSRFVVLI